MAQIGQNGPLAGRIEMATFNWISSLKEIYSEGVDSMIAEIPGVSNVGELLSFLKDYTLFGSLKGMVDVKTLFNEATQTAIDTAYSDFETHVSSEYSMTMPEFTEFSVTAEKFLDILTQYKEVVF